ncbi:MAG TPA: peptidoglycan DD-metalloendopeptidase family protein [bacterium]|nr:peptidoglycan DD-metalloendopeptidase family protein [bacterium]
MYTRRKISLTQTLVILLAIGFVIGSWFFYQQAKAKNPDLVDHLAEPTPPPPPTPTPIPGIPVNGIINQGQNLFSALVDAQVPEAEANLAVDRLREIEFPFLNIRPGQEFTLYLSEDGRLNALDYSISRLEIYQLRREGENLTAKREVIPTTTEVHQMAARVETCVYNAILDQKESNGLASLVSNLFAWDIDFSSDPRKGDSFKLIFEKVKLPDGDYYGYGRLLAGEYDGEITGRKQGFWLDVGNEEYNGFYDENGQQMKKTFLRAPLDTMRVTSSFGMRRHPILGDRRMHHGVDYGAPVGTPVWAVADGTVSFGGRSGAAGNLVTIKHDGGFESLYLHLSRIAVKRGQRVRQRQMIGRVGSSGRSTGPHLDFRIRRNGSYFNPMKMKMYSQPAKKLPDQYRPQFEAVMEQMRPRLEAIVPPAWEPPAENAVAEETPNEEE